MKTSFKKFVSEKETALEVIKAVLGENSSYEDGKYYLHYTADEEADTIEFFSSYTEAEATEVIGYDFDEEFYKKVSEITGIPYFTESHLAEEYQGWEDFSEAEREQIYYDENEKIINKTFELFEGHPDFDDDFTAVAEGFYEIIKDAYSN